MTVFIDGTGGGGPRYSLAGSLAAAQNVAGATLSAWTSYFGGATTNEQIIAILSTGTSLASARAAITMRHSDGVFRASGRRLDADAVSVINGTTAISTTRRHICGVFNYAGGLLQLYVDGTLEGNLAVGGWAGNSSNTASLGAAIGGRPDGNATSSLDASEVDDVQIFSRALSATEVRNLALSRGHGNSAFGRFSKFGLKEQPEFVNNTPIYNSAISGGSAAAVGTPTSVGGLSCISAGRRRRRR